LTAEIENVFDVPEQIEAFPVIDPGKAGTEFTVIANVCAVEEPQALFALTVMLPLTAPAVAVILVVVEVPVQPDGNVHV
jgi:hypothetical protein